MKPKFDLTLYLCTDRKIMTCGSVEQSVKLAIEGGCTFVQLREKQVSSKEFYETALAVKRVTDFYHIPFVINDRIDIALAVDADGVHIGQQDIPAGTARKVLGGKKIIGVTAPSAELAISAQQQGASYIGVGAMFATSTKENAKVITPATLKAIRKSVSIPIVAIGGITSDNLHKINVQQINGIAAAGAILGSENIALASKCIKEEFLRLKESG